MAYGYSLGFFARRCIVNNEIAAAQAGDQHQLAIRRELKPIGSECFGIESGGYFSGFGFGSNPSSPQITPLKGTTPKQWLDAGSQFGLQMLKGRFGGLQKKSALKASKASKAPFQCASLAMSLSPNLPNCLVSWPEFCGFDAGRRELSPLFVQDDQG